ncbi:MAG: hypothetical protein ABI425_03220 [Patescibacteria group bacterium]
MKERSLFSRLLQTFVEGAKLYSSVANGRLYLDSPVSPYSKTESAAMDLNQTYIKKPIDHKLSRCTRKAFMQVTAREAQERAYIQQLVKSLEEVRNPQGHFSKN